METIRELRKNLRIKENIPVKWFNQDSDTSGKARVRNLSASGLCFETNSSFQVGEGSIVDFDSFLQGQGIFSPLLGRVVWKKNGAKKTTCGIEFVGQDERVISKIRERVQQRIVNLASQRKVKTVAAVMLLGVLFGLGFVTAKQYSLLSMDLRSFQDMMLATSSSQASLYRSSLQQIASIKETLAETQALLAQAQKENVALVSQLNELKQQHVASSTNTAGVEGMIADLKTQNAEMVAQIDELKSKLHFYERDIESLQDGKELLSVYKSKMKTVKGQMSGIKRKAYEAKVAAQTELDRILLLRGNKGFFVRDGIAYIPGSFENENKNVEVRVEFFK